MAPSASYLFDTQRHYMKSAQDAVDSQVIGNTYVVNSDVPKPRALGAVGLLIPSATHPSSAMELLGRNPAAQREAEAYSQAGRIEV